MALETANITVNDGSNPVSGVKVTLYREGQGFFGTAITNGSGVASFSALVSPGVVWAKVEKEGYRAPKPDPFFTVPNTNGVTPFAGTVSMVDLDIEKPSGVAYCTIYGMVEGEADLFYEVGGSYLEPGDRGSAIGAFPVQASAGASKIKIEPDGSWAIDLPRGVMARIFCLSPKLSRLFRVPLDKDAVQVKDLRGWFAATNNLDLAGNTSGVQGDGSSP